MTTGEAVNAFGYGFFCMSQCKVIEAVPKWSPLAAKPAPVRIPVVADRDRMTLTLTQDMVRCERVLNVLNVPVDSEARGRGYILVRVLPREGWLYPDIEIIDENTGEAVEVFRPSELPEPVVRQLVIGDDHVVRWPGSTGETAFPEIVDLGVGDFVEYTCRDAGFRPSTGRGTIKSISRIADCMNYQRAMDWDIRRWRFFIIHEGGGHLAFVPRQLTDIRLARRKRRTG